MALHAMVVSGEIWLCSASESAVVSVSRRKIASTMITVASTISPKSIAPTDSRLADSPAQHQDDDGEEQRERNRGADDQRAAQVAEEHPLQQNDQDDADHHVVQHGRVVMSIRSLRS